MLWTGSSVVEARERLMVYAIAGMAFALIVMAIGAYKQKNGIGRNRNRNRD